MKTVGSLSLHRWWFSNLCEVVTTLVFSTLCIGQGFVEQIEGTMSKALTIGECRADGGVAKGGRAGEDRRF